MTILEQKLSIDDEIMGEWSRNLPDFYEWLERQTLDWSLQIREKALACAKLHLKTEVAPEYGRELAVELYGIRVADEGVEPYELEGGRKDLREVLQALLANSRWTDIEPWAKEQVHKALAGQESGA